MSPSSPAAQAAPPSRAPALLRMRGPAVIGAVFGCLVLCMPVAGAHPHTSVPPVDVVFTWSEGGLDAVIDLSKHQILSWIPNPSPRVDLDAVVPDDVALARLLTRLEVALDGTVVTPRLRRLSEGGGPNPELFPRVQLLVHYPYAREPRHVRVLWKEFLGIFWENASQVPVVVNVGPQVDSVTLTPEEPEFHWRWRPPAAFRSPALALPRPERGLTLPVATLALVALALLLPFVGPWRRSGALRRLAPTAATLVVALGIHALDLGRVETRLGRAQPPSQSQAQLVVTTLIQSVYKAFDATSETAVYDLLAGSVEPSLLRDLYAEVVESLVLREKGGGALCRVDEVTLETIVPHIPEDVTTQFAAEASWTVKGSVSHWGHTHLRVNQYRAHLTLRNDGSSWRIGAVQMLEHKRIDDGTLRPE